MSLLEETLKGLLEKGILYVSLALRDGEFVEVFKVNPYYRHMHVIPESEWEKFLSLPTLKEAMREETTS
ncbi:hypothetical protein MUP77_19640 [Candidatus Bathyarchaeota archaeon]|nr:hypothetical protein [Candidatus Bathyarchaeota archaeon]